ncbi:family 16 glycoside hydrolase [Bremerella cremea]|uniref:family 16 glycoside hydrolase n=1 Tax=Bremerella cremea TaxID=1031537 RepID=UPI0031EA353F
MRRLPIVSAALLSCLPAFAFAEPPARTNPPGELQFADQFERDETFPGKEELGEGWTTNSPWRAKGHQQVDLVEGSIHITRYPEADHGVAVFHPVDFADGTVQLKFRIGKGDQLGVDFADKSLKTVHAGHLCIANITLDKLVINDSKTGRMDLKIRDRILAKEKSPELTQLLKEKSAVFPLKLKADTWYQLQIQITGNQMTVSIDGAEVGRLESEGIAHPTKKHIALAVKKEAWVDDVQIWKAK